MSTYVLERLFTGSAARWCAVLLAAALTQIYPAMLKAQDADSSDADDQIYQTDDSFDRNDDPMMFETSAHFDTTSPAWQWQNPFPTGSHLFAVDALHADSMYAVGHLGATLKTTDGGISWYAGYKTSGIPGAIYGVDEVTPDLVYAVGTTGAIIMTSDQAMGEGIAKNPATFGISNLGTAMDMQGKYKILALDGVAQAGLELEAAGSVLIGVLAAALGPRGAMAAMGLAGAVGILLLVVLMPSSRKIK